MPATQLPLFQEANAKFVSSFTAGDLPLPPARKTAIVACMDARLHPEKALGIEIGDSHVIRNAGGRVSDDALRSLAISQQLLGTNEIYIVHHTDCGMVTFSNDSIRSLLKERLGTDASAIDFLPFPDLEQSVVDDVDIVVKSPLINPGTPVTGLVYDVKTGSVKVVATGETPAKA